MVVPGRTTSTSNITHGHTGTVQCIRVVARISDTLRRLLTAKLTEYAMIEAAAQIILSITRESNMHVAFCESWGISELELRDTPESPATSAYGGYLLDIGIQGMTMASCSPHIVELLPLGDVLKLTVAFMACLICYGEVGLFLLARSKDASGEFLLEGNPYTRWIEDYSGEWYQEAVHRGLCEPLAFAPSSDKNDS